MCHVQNNLLYLILKLDSDRNIYLFRLSRCDNSISFLHNATTNNRGGIRTLGVCIIYIPCLHLSPDNVLTFGGAYFIISRIRPQFGENRIVA